MGGRVAIRRSILVVMVIALVLLGSASILVIEVPSDRSQIQAQKQQIDDLQSQVQNLEQQVVQLTTLVGNLESEAGTSAAQGSKEGVLLVVSTNSTKIGGDDSVLLTADAVNTLPMKVKVTGFGNWSVTAIGIPCGSYFSLPVGIAVFQGNYTIAELRDLQPLIVSRSLNRTTALCLVATPEPLMGYDSIRLIHDYSEFQPLSDVYQPVTHWLYSGLLGTKTVAGPSGSNVQGTASSNLILKASYLIQAGGPGVYTVAALTTWGQMAVTYVQVTPS